MPVRRFPPLWTAEVTPNCFIVRDATGQQLAASRVGSNIDRAAGAIANALSFSAAVGGAAAIPIEVTIGPAPFTLSMASLA